jgi:hypothetical protein
MARTTRCKFTCQSVTKTKHWSEQGRFLYTAKFSAASDGTPENKAFFEYTPAGELLIGELLIGTYKEDVFAVGQDYYLDLSIAAPEPVAVG